MFVKRDTFREKAIHSQLDEDWTIYREWRNKCTDSVRKNKKEHFLNLFENMEKGGDVKGLYRSTKEQLGWLSGGPPSPRTYIARLLAPFGVR